PSRGYMSTAVHSSTAAASAPNRAGRASGSTDGSTGGGAAPTGAGTSAPRTSRRPAAVPTARTLIAGVPAAGPVTVAIRATPTGVLAACDSRAVTGTPDSRATSTVTGAAGAPISTGPLQSRASPRWARSQSSAA